MIASSSVNTVDTANTSSLDDVVTAADPVVEVNKQAINVIAQPAKSQPAETTETSVNCSLADEIVVLRSDFRWRGIERRSE